MRAPITTGCPSLWGARRNPPQAVGRPHKLPQLAPGAHPVLVPGARGRPQLHAAEDPVLAVEEEVQQVEAVEAAHGGGHGCEEAGSGPQPRPHVCPPPPQGSTGHPGSQGGRGGSEEHRDLCGTTRCTCTVRVKLPNPAFFSPKRSAQIPKGSPQPPQPHHAPGQRSRMRPQSSALLSSPVRPRPAPGRSG